MIPPSLLPDLEQGGTLKSRFAIGRAYELHLPSGPRAKAQVYHRGALLKEVDLGEKAQRNTAKYRVRSCFVPFPTAARHGSAKHEEGSPR